MPDALLAYSFAGTDVEVNLLPLLLIGIALMDSYLKPTSTRQTQMRFLIVCIVLLLLIYALPASVCLY
jgi:membrane protein insertase Oxa1/YidC/SpoIIIJ